MKMSNIFAAGLGLGIVSGVFLGMGMGRHEAAEELDYYKDKLNKSQNAVENLIQYNKGVIDGLDIASGSKSDEDEYPFARVVGVGVPVDLADILERINRVHIPEDHNCDECPVSDFCANAHEEGED